MYEYPANFTFDRSEPCSPMIRARSTEEMRADLELVNLGKENWGEGDSSPLFKRPSSLCVKTPVSKTHNLCLNSPPPDAMPIVQDFTYLKLIIKGEDPDGCVHFHPCLQGGQGEREGFG